ncbi:unnamed protein product [Cylicocyclus nassatus]|uniref:Uncharacterized protein n=1 Tax=Cylicocyclus nassatus TaxID=53992 RepID=A0AA36M4Z3_CYLNA|nr:unnamed protein product [Cylicocyclus nassatus]
MATGSHSKIVDEDLGRVMGICRYLNLSFTEPQTRAIIDAINAGANPTALVQWLQEVEKSKREPALEHPSMSSLCHSRRVIILIFSSGLLRR